MKKFLTATLLCCLPLAAACSRSEPAAQSDEHVITAAADPKLVRFEQLTIRQVSAGSDGAYAVAEDGSLWWLTQGIAHRVKELDPRLTTLDPNAPLPSPGTSGGAMPGSGSTPPLHPIPSDSTPILPVSQFPTSNNNVSPPTTAVARPAKKAVKKKTVTKKSLAKKSAANKKSAAKSQQAPAKKSTKKQA